MLAYIRKALTAASVSGIGTAIFAAVSDGQFTQEEIAGVIGVVLAAFGLTWLIPNKPQPDLLGTQPRPGGLSRP